MCHSVEASQPNALKREAWSASGLGRPIPWPPESAPRSGRVTCLCCSSAGAGQRFARETRKKHSSSSRTRIAEPSKANLRNSTSGSQLYQPQMHNPLISLHNEAQWIRRTARRAPGIGLLGEFAPSAVPHPVYRSNHHRGTRWEQQEQRATNKQQLLPTSAMMTLACWMTRKRRVKGPRSPVRTSSLSRCSSLRRCSRNSTQNQNNADGFRRPRTSRRAQHGLSTSDPLSTVKVGVSPTEPTRKAAVDQRPARHCSDVSQRWERGAAAWRASRACQTDGTKCRSAMRSGAP